MKAKDASPARRRPRQRRAQQTVDAVLDSVARLLERGGVEAVTTNRIAEVAGVSIGSVYQYFPNKQAIYGALLDRHLEQIARIVEAKLIDRADASLEERVRSLVEAQIAAHASDPRLHELLFTQVPHRADADREHDARLRRAYRRALESRANDAVPPRDLDRMLFVLTHLVEALAHGAVLRRPPGVSLAAASDEAVRAVLAYLRA